MSTDEEDIDIMNNGSDDELADTVTCQPTPTTEHCQSTVSARTDGIRGKRYNDFDFITEPECELTDCELDVVGDGTNLSVDPCLQAEVSVPQIESDKVSPTQVRKPGVAKLPSTQPDSPQLTTGYKSEIENNKDIHGIMSLIKVERLDEACYVDGIGQLLSAHRQTNVIAIDSSDDEVDTKDNSDAASTSSDDSLQNNAISITSDVARISKLDIKDHLENREVFPEVEIVDLTLAASEEILPLGRIYRIVDDFVVIKCLDSHKILDLDSMIFDENRKCVGYIFEVLGLVSDPYYSLHFNTNSDILSLGLHLNQDLYYSPNEKYARYVLVDMLREMEHRKKRVVNVSDGESEDDDDGSDQSCSEDRPEEATRKQNCRKRKSQEQGPKVLHRTTVNYSLKYTSNVPKHQKFNDNRRPFPSQWNSLSRNNHQNPTSMYSNPPPLVPPPFVPPPFVPTSPSFHPMPPAFHQHSFSSPRHGNSARTPLNSSTHFNPPNSFLNIQKNSDSCRTSDLDVSTNSKSSFQKSVLASFLDPSSLDKPPESQ